MWPVNHSSMSSLSICGQLAILLGHHSLHVASRPFFCVFMLNFSYKYLVKYMLCFGYRYLKFDKTMPCNEKKEE